jgi:hypothetical protein
MGNIFLDHLVDKSLTKEQLLVQVKHDFTLLPIIVNGMGSSKAAIRYGCGKVLVELSEDYPEKLYSDMDFFLKMLDSSYRISIWQAMAIIANLTVVDTNKMFDHSFTRYYRFICDEYMVTVANVVGHSDKIALAKPYLIPRITDELLKVESLAVTPHLTEECKRVIAEKVIDSFSQFFDQVEQKEKVVTFVRKQVNSPRDSLHRKATEFLQKWDIPKK